MQPLNEQHNFFQQSIYIAIHRRNIADQNRDPRFARA